MNKSGDTLIEIGKRLRAARLKSNLRLAEVAAKTNLSESSLSRIEHGSIAVSVMNLVRLCDVLSITVTDLFDKKPAPAKTSVQAHTSRGQAFEEVEATGYRWRHLVGGAPLDAFNVFHLILPENEQMKTLVSHPGQEHCYVLQGEVDFYVGEERHRLKAGDGILLDSELPHRAERVGAKTAHILMTVTRPNAERLEPEWWNLTMPGNSDASTDDAWPESIA
ncbi:helix-turn-helix domain-containing protein [Methylocapsa sp. S129]|uniref:helix-turn-helix domain-containing protein n=1 Tax=Methylocapsa sp. S129 TaxID=1641869 RepID=UPI00131AE624|nr:XRE family transcriptional regulator [Methylocapsa sp. S129]